MACNMTSSPLWNQKGNLCQNVKIHNAHRFSIVVDLTTHLNELNMHLQGENHLICATFQIITMFEMKFKL